MSGHAGDERLGPYRLRERLGEGGMGVVYLASDQADELVAIKVLRPAFAGEETARHRLAREVATMRRVASPHVAEVLDADVTGEQPYIVTRYVPGKTLEHLVAEDGPLTGSALAVLAAGLAGALVAVHAAGVVHRDLKPGNVMLVDGEPVVIDFGIAQASDVTRLTLTGMFIGTPGYLAPEVIEGRASGAAADIHSWGATLAYAATGRPPFGSGTFEAIFYRIVHGQPDLDAMPGPLVPLVLAALARDPAKRPSAAELAASVADLDPVGLTPAPSASDAVATGARSAAAAVNGEAAALAGAGHSLALPVAQVLAKTAADHQVPVAVLPASRPLEPVTVPVSLQPAGNGQAPRADGVPAQAPSRPAALPGSAAVPLVLATIVIFVAVSIVLPVIGAAVVLGLLILLRAADLLVRWLDRRRARGGTGAVASAALVPWAIVRSVLRFVLLAPLALMCAAGAAVVSVIASGASDLPRTVGFASGALVAFYCLGPGSAACRRPMSALYGKLTTSRLATTAGYVAVAALAVLCVGAATSLAPGYWPALHLGQQLQNAPLNHPLLTHLPGNLGQVGQRLVSWVGHRL